MNKTQASIDAADIAVPNAVAFIKMQALGNDFVFVLEDELAAAEGGKSVLKDLKTRGAVLAKNVCDRHFGIGADGFIVVRKASKPGCDLSWMYFNSDGSISAMCGNGIRCLGLYGVQRRLVSGKQLNVQTELATVPVTVDSEDSISTDLGVPQLTGDKVPVKGKDRQPVLLEPLWVGGHNLRATCVGMGNPHCVIFEESWKEDSWRALSPEIQQLPFFPEGVNVEFVQALSPQHARVFVWERGCGPTLACASGAAAVLVAGVLEKRLERNALIDLPGGSLRVSWDEQDEHVRITGSARISYSGNFDLTRFLSEGKP